MDQIAQVLLDAGYFRVRISSLSDFDKIIGGMAWAMQVFSHDINIDIFYKDTLDLGQKIGLTERLVMVLLAMKCPHSLEPHQIVGLDYENLLPAIRWLIKRSQEVRREHEAFNRLLALRHYHRVTSTQAIGGRHLISVRDLKQQRSGGRGAQHESVEGEKSSQLLARIDEQFKDNKRVSFVKLPSLFKAMKANEMSTRREPMGEKEDSRLDGDEDEEELSSSSGNEHTDGDQTTYKRPETPPGKPDDPLVTQTANKTDPSEEELMLNRELDTELIATNQKILNLLKKLDSMPSDLEIMQYQRRYVELHQQLISKNKDVKKLFDLFNSLDGVKFYLTKEINLLDSILGNLDLTNNSASNRDLFMKQFQQIIEQIQLARLDVQTKLTKMAQRCDSLNGEYMTLMSQLDS